MLPSSSIGRESDLVELLALTACQTAVGDDRAALGLAGVGRAGWCQKRPGFPLVYQDAPVSNSVLRQLEQLRREQSRGSAYGSTRTDCGWGQYAHPPTGRSSSSVTGCSLIIRRNVPCCPSLLAFCLRFTLCPLNLCRFWFLQLCESFNSVEAISQVSRS